MENTAASGKRFVEPLLLVLLAATGCAGSTLDHEESTDSSASAFAMSGTPQLKYLASLPAEKHGELALARLFAQGTATYVPTGSAAGYPVIFNSVPELNGVAAQLWGGKTFRVVSSATHPNGDPIVRLDNKIIQTPSGGLLDLFDAYVTRGVVGDLAIGVNGRGQPVEPPVGTLAPAHVSFLDLPVAIDDRPSVILNYFEDRSLPVIRRVLDEIREVDGARCKGLFLGRAHVRRCVSLSCGEVPSPVIDFPERPVFETTYQWRFWTYFLLDFGQAGGGCNLAPVVAAVEQQLQGEGIDADLPPAPSSPQ